MSDFDLADQADTELHDPASGVYGAVSRGLKNMADVAANVARGKILPHRKTGELSRSISTGVDAGRDGTPEAYLEVSGYGMSGAALPGIAAAIGNRQHETANVAPLIKGVMERTGTYRHADGPWLKESVWETEQAWNSSKVWE